MNDQPQTTKKFDREWWGAFFYGISAGLVIAVVIRHVI